MTITDTEHDHTPHETADDPHGAGQTAPDTAGPGTADVDSADADSVAAVDELGELGELLSVDPRDLFIGANVRGDAPLGRAFLRSIRDRGVREPIIARRTDDGALVVRKGKRRTLAAIETGRASVPVLVEPGPAPRDDDRAGQIERIVDQLEENLHRASNSDVEEVGAHQELLDLGLTAGQIARRTHTSTQRVKVTTAVARSALAAEALARYDLTLDQVAVIAEFDDTRPDREPSEASAQAVALLTATVQQNPGQFEHVAQRLRDDHEDARQVAARTAELTAAGVRVIDPDTIEGAAQISGLRPTADDPNGTELTEPAHTACPGHAAQVEIRRGWGRETQLSTVYWCTDPNTHGHAARWTRTTTAGAGAGTGAGAREPGPLSDTDKAARRRVIANNKDWDSATTVRRDWLRGFLARKTPPRNALPFIAASLGRAGHYLRKAMESGHPTACELLGMTPTGSVYHSASSGLRSPIAAAADTAAAPRATILTLAMLLGAAEDATSGDTWRNPTSDDRAYFTALTEWGYPLSDVEQLVLTPDNGPTAADGEAGTDEAATDESVAATDLPVDADDAPREETGSNAA